MIHDSTRGSMNYSIEFNHTWSKKLSKQTDTPSKINMSFEKGPFLRINLIFQPSIFKGYVSFQGGK